MDNHNDGATKKLEMRNLIRTNANENKLRIEAGDEKLNENKCK